ncbi:hypothetical protein L798_15751 [Zootermopsis nevadensis]|uniref:Protein Wnt n=1 Tax=Zootermopsis nevadensis TaxID=136037 RepID=A0A067RHD7_ZOONE|nr:hypothetical protein L798_15751 [Zootermopsis nevadensis]
MSSVVAALEAHVICGRIPGLTARQREMCRSSPDAMVAVGDGVRLGTVECQEQFRHRRWNCSAIGSGSVFGHVVVVGSREAAFTYAVSSAGVAYAVPAQQQGGPQGRDGAKRNLFNKFPDTPLLPSPCRPEDLFNLHVTGSGILSQPPNQVDEYRVMVSSPVRQAVKVNLHVECKCHGVSGSCTMKTCWKTLPAFRQIGDSLMRKYSRARAVMAVDVGSRPGRRSRNLQLVLRKPPPRGQQLLEKKRAPRRSDLVFLQESPNYCERDPATGSMGTVGRHCNRTSRGTEGCDLMCCGRGYNTHQFTRTWQCRCKFHWCCYVKCDTCSERTEEYTCK